MRQLMLKGKLYHVCYMDDMVIITKTQWHLRAAIRPANCALRLKI